MNLTEVAKSDVKRLVWQLKSLENKYSKEELLEAIHCFEESTKND